jgi:hypothetical protein
MTQEQDKQENRARLILGWAPENTLPARAREGQDLTPAERVLAVTLLGLPVSKEAA